MGDGLQPEQNGFPQEERSHGQINLSVILYMLIVTNHRLFWASTMYHTLHTIQSLCCYLKYLTLIFNLWCTWSYCLVFVSEVLQLGDVWLQWTAEVMHVPVKYWVSIYQPVNITYQDSSSVIGLTIASHISSLCGQKNLNITGCIAMIYGSLEEHVWIA